MQELNEMLDSIQTIIVITTSVLGILGVIVGHKIRDAILAIVQWPFNLLWKLFDRRPLEQKIDKLVEELPKIQHTVDALDRVEQNTQTLIDTIELKHGLLTAKFIAFLDQPGFSPMFDTSEDGEFLWVSASFISMAGKPSDELLGWGWVNSVHEDDLENVRAEWARAIRERRIFKKKMRFVANDGTVFSTETKAVPVHFNDNIEGWFGFVTILNKERA